MTAKNELAETLTAHGIALPPTWGKFSKARAQAWTDAELGGRIVDDPAVPNEAEFIMVNMGGNKSPTMPKNPKWKRSTGGGRGWYPGKSVAVDLATASRQVRRAAERRSNKMPIGAKQSVWHASQGFGKIGNGRKKKFLVSA